MKITHNISVKSNISLAISLLPVNLQSVLLSFDAVTPASITEIRLRKNKPVILYILDRPFFISRFGKAVNHYSPDCMIIGDADFDYTVDNLCNNSYHSHINTMLNGYVTAPCGIRAGIASNAVYRDGKLHSVKDITSLCIRISKEIINCSRPVLNMLYASSLPSVVIAGASCLGKKPLS